MWQPGTDLRMRLTVCCPSCGSDLYRMTHKHGKAIRYLECCDCKHRWKRVNDDGVRRVLVAAV
jgi:formate dehydrogenase maturation protein FdhE